MDILKVLRRQRRELEKIDRNNFRQITDAYMDMYDDLEGDVDALRLAIEELENPSSAEIKALPQYKRLLKNAEKELDRFIVFLETAVAAAGVAAIGMGLDHSKELMRLMSGKAITGLEARAMRTLLDYLRRDGPLYERLKLITDSTIEKVVQVILDGVGLGYNPRKIADMIQDAFGGGLTDALRNIRTVQLYAYRDSARANYIASDGLVRGWIWFAELDADVCLSCAAQHGTIHDLDETLDDHYNGRCAAIPLIEGFDNPIETSGKEWFDGLSEQQQREMMGNSKWQAYQDGKFDFLSLSQQHENDIYGTMRSEASLKSLLGE